MMRKIINSILILAVSICLVGCYGLDDQNFKTLAGIEIKAPSDVVSVKLAETLKLNIQAISENDRPMTYEWCYGRINNTFPNMVDSTVISHTLTVDYTFQRVGQYVLRLKVDNGESIVFKYFTLNVETGVDEGILILNSDASDIGHLTFIKTRSPEEIAANEQEVWPDIMATINPDVTLKNVTDLYMSTANIKSVTYASLVISTADEFGSIYNLAPQTFEMAYYNKMAVEFGGQKPMKMVGEASSSAAYYMSILGSGGDLYRYDLFSGEPAWRNGDINITHASELHNGDAKIMVLRSSNAIYTPQNNALNPWIAPENQKVVNVAANRTGTAKVVPVIVDKTNEKLVSLYSMSSKFSKPLLVASYTSANPICMDENSILVGSNQAPSYNYYSYNNAIYRFDVAALGASSVLPTLPVITLPAGEQITSINVNGGNFDHDPVEDQLYVATYNPSRAGDKKGSLYIYKFSDHTLLKSYEGICDKPVKVLYKFRI